MQSQIAAKQQAEAKKLLKQKKLEEKAEAAAKAQEEKEARLAARKKRREEMGIAKPSAKRSRANRNPDDPEEDGLDVGDEVENGEIDASDVNQADLQEVELNLENERAVTATQGKLVSVHKGRSNHM